MIGDYKKKNKIKNLFSKKNNLLDYSKKLNVKNNFIFYGHKSFPENILTNCQYLIKLTREDNPWGRDIIEAIYLGLGIIATGQKSDLIKNNLNGFLLKKYDPKKISKLLLKIDKKIIKKHQKNSKELSNKLFNNKILKIQFENFWKQFSKKT